MKRSITTTDNPFERFDLDPREGARGITERMRELMEAAESDAERKEIRAAWEELTLHPATRVRAALLAHPGRLPHGAPPGSLTEVAHDDALETRDLAAPASVAAALGDDADAPLEAQLDRDPWLTSDPSAD